MPRSLITLFLLLTITSLGQEAKQPIRHRDKPADAAELAQISERGKLLASYDAISWHATDEVQAARPKDGAVEMYLGKQTATGWNIAFGKLNPAKDAFLLAYETTPTADIKHPKLTINTPAIEDRGEWLHEALAYDTARNALEHKTIPYNGAVLRATNGWYVYFYPAQTTNNVFPLGADVRYRVSEDGTRIEETHQMHASLLKFDLTDPGKKTQSTFRTAFLDDAPEDTDVATVLMMGGVPMLIAGQNFTYQISADGTPICLGTTKDFLKGAKK